MNEDVSTDAALQSQTETVWVREFNRRLARIIQDFNAKFSAGNKAPGEVALIVARRMIAAGAAQYVNSCRLYNEQPDAAVFSKTAARVYDNEVKRHQGAADPTLAIRAALPMAPMPSLAGGDGVSTHAVAP